MGIKKFLVGLGAMAVVLVGCQNEERFELRGYTEHFIQDFNPEFIDILWVIDDRSPMANIKISLGRDHLTHEATHFFRRLDEA